MKESQSKEQLRKMRNKSKDMFVDPEPLRSSSRKDIYESGMKWMKERNSRLIGEQSKKLNEEIDGLDFKPKINKNSQYYSTISKSFEKRQ